MNAGVRCAPSTLARAALARQFDGRERCWCNTKAGDARLRVTPGDQRRLRTRIKRRFMFALLNSW